jgi:hypothetical protein
MDKQINEREKDFFLSPRAYSQRLSWAEKSKNNFKWAEKVADWIDYQIPSNILTKKRKDLDRNYKIANGFGDGLSDFMRNQIVDPRLEEQGGLSPEHERIPHHDIISQIVNAMHGEQLAMPFVFSAVDSSEDAKNERKRVKNQMLGEYVNQKYIEPIRQQVAQNLMAQMGIEDPYAMSPEEQQEFMAQVEQETQAQTPEEIAKYMRSGFKGVSEIQAQRLLNILVKKLDLKYITDEGFKHAIITGEEVYHVGVRHNRPFVELVNAKNFESVGGSDNFFIQDDEMAKYERTISYTDVFNKYGDILTKEDIKKLDSIVDGYGLYGSTVEEQIESSVIGAVGFNDAKGGLTGVSALTKAGERHIRAVKDRLSDIRLSTVAVRETHLVWKSLRKLYHLKRVSPEGDLQMFFVAENYVFNRTKGDIEMKEVWVPEVWETTKIGQYDGLYINKRPIPYQNRSLSNPWDVKLPYIGAKYNKLMNNTENISPVTRALPYAHDYNVQMAMIKEKEKTDLGKVMLMTMSAKPDNWSWKHFFDVIRTVKMVPLDLKKEEVSQFDANFFKSVDLSSMYDILPRLQYLQKLREDAAIAMSFNTNRLGLTSPYTTVANNQDAIGRSLNQTGSLFNTHRKVVEMVLNALLHASRVAYKENPEYFATLLDDGTLAELDIDPEVLWRSEISIHVSNSTEDFSNIQTLKQTLLQPMLQNGLSVSSGIKLQWAKSKAEIDQIVEEFEQRNAEAQQQQQEAMMASEEQREQLRKDFEELKFNFQRILQDENNANKIRLAEINSTVLANQNDINNNNENDFMEIKKVEVKSREKIESEKIKLEKEKLKTQEKIKKMEIDAKMKALTRKK